MYPSAVTSLLADNTTDEWARVEAWRLKTLIDAGYAVADAENLASRPEVDLHGAVGLLEQGCEPKTAAEILR